MKFYGKKHRTRIKRFEALWESLKPLSEMASEFGIDDIFQDNGAKVLQQLVYLNMKPLQGREGNDCISNSGREWEMKSINIATSARSFSTNHHVTASIIAKYRGIPWSFAVYNDLDLLAIYVMSPETLAPVFDRWEKKLEAEGKQSLNNPKIPLSFVKRQGVRVYPIDAGSPLDPDSVV